MDGFRKPSGFLYITDWVLKRTHLVFFGRSTAFFAISAIPFYPRLIAFCTLVKLLTHIIKSGIFPRAKILGFFPCVIVIQKGF